MNFADSIVSNLQRFRPANLESQTTADTGHVERGGLRLHASNAFDDDRMRLILDRLVSWASQFRCSHEHAPPHSVCHSIRILYNTKSAHSVSFNTEFTMSSLLQYHPSAALAYLADGRFEGLKADLENARDETLNDVELWQSGAAVPPAKDPLDAGFIQWPEELLLDLNENGDNSLVARIENCAARIRETADGVVILGIGGSYMGMKAMFDALGHPYHNELSRSERNGVPRIYYEGWNVDSDQQKALLNLCEQRAVCATDNTVADARTAVIVISKSGGTMETAVSFRNFRALIERQFGDDAKRLIVPVTGDSGKLRDLSNEAGFEDVFSIPDGIGGRFSVLTPVGLLPAAVAGLNVRQLLQGAVAMTDHFRHADYGSNAVLDYTAVGHAFEVDQGLTTRILSTWGSKLEAVGLWYDQLLSESLGKHEKGATPLTVVNTRDLHSRGQQHQEGRRDKLITNLLPGAPNSDPLTLPEREDDHDQLNKFAGYPLPKILQAAIDGTNQAYADDNRPTADILLPTVNEHTIGQVFQMLMLATVVEGRLVGTNPYGQPGVEAYKKNMNANLSQG
ncbi:Glucose-6-phosphate isomerase [Fuerstiella marisgermanici]|uniref:Glucose-6-phosphate isomerase n=2 Tax=Fuerstiella marisgermanici TaxID=1891926 RepID=A0A1P8WE61_9PLAN|nr:Glucose-6-phosphate isomerase [Fuerstiella marisgermanici]